ncbi:MAG: hypothetical protein MHM6MM_009058, partial [Cercozoa sp. M6MM]
MSEQLAQPAFTQRKTTYRRRSVHSNETKGAALHRHEYLLVRSVSDETRNNIESVA